MGAECAILIDSFELDDMRRFTIHPPIHIVPSDQDGLLVAEYPELNIHSFAQSRARLIAELEGEIAMIWNEFACEHDSNLTEGAIRLKDRLQARIKPCTK